MQARKEVVDSSQRGPLLSRCLCYDLAEKSDDDNNVKELERLRILGLVPSVVGVLGGPPHRYPLIDVGGVHVDDGGIGLRRAAGCDVAWGVPYAVWQ